MSSEQDSEAMKITQEETKEAKKNQKVLRALGFSEVDFLEECED